MYVYGWHLATTILVCLIKLKVAERRTAIFYAAHTQKKLMAKPRCCYLFFRFRFNLRDFGFLRNEKGKFMHCLFVN